MMILCSPNGYTFKYHAVRNKKSGKIHIKHVSGLTECSRHVDNLEVDIDEIDDYKTFIGIMKETNLCKKCKEEILQVIDSYTFYFPQEVQIEDLN